MGAAGSARVLIYDAAIVRLTAGWYRAVLERLPRGCRLLDVGIGTGSALLANADLVVDKDVCASPASTWTPPTCGAAIARIAKAGLGRSHRRPARVRLRSPRRPLRRGLLQRQLHAAARPAGGAAARLLAAGAGRAACTSRRPSSTSARAPSRSLKPLLRLATTIDFGRVTYEADFRRALAAGGVELEELVALDGGRRRSSVLAVARGLWKNVAGDR